MEQGGISIISPPDVTDNSAGKSKNFGMTFGFNGSVQSAKEKLKAPNATWWKIFLDSLAELIGTAILILLGCTGGIGSLGAIPSQMQSSLTFGIGVMIAVQCVGHISGAHLNPCITLAAVILGDISLLTAGFYVIAQCLGGLTGYGLLKAITPQELLHNGNLTTASSFCMTDVNEKLTAGYGVTVEILATGILIFFACSAWDSRNARNTDSTAIKFGLGITALSFAFGPYTGCSMNPARTLAPAIWNDYWRNHWIYWVGPIGGTVIAVSIYRCLFSLKRNQEDSMRDMETLNGIETS